MNLQFITYDNFRYYTSAETREVSIDHAASEICFLSL